MSKIQIRHRWTDGVLFECDPPEGLASGLHMRHALEKAVAARANLAGANLAYANLAYANLAGANLAGANLAGAYLAYANLAGAYLAGANLAGAYLADANLAGANLAYAYLAYANLADAYLADAKLRADLTLVGERPVMWIGPIGSVSRTVYAWITNQGLRIQAGCFFGTRDEFTAQLSETHGDNEHAQEYAAALVLIDAHTKLWTPAEVTA